MDLAKLEKKLLFLRQDNMSKFISLQNLKKKAALLPFASQGRWDNDLW
jgi:hypothetical protein